MLPSLPGGSGISNLDPAVLHKVSEANRCGDNSKNQGKHPLVDLLARVFAKVLQWGDGVTRTEVRGTAAGSAGH